MTDVYSPCPECGAVNRLDWHKAGQSKPKCPRCKATLDFSAGITSVSLAGLRALQKSSPQPILVDFWAPWCGPCVGFAPVFQRMSEEFAGKVSFVKLDTQAHPDAGAAFGIRGIPTLMLFQGDHLLGQVSGALAGGQLKSWIQQHLH